MMPQSGLKIILTPEQQAIIEQVTGQRVAAVELKPEALECRAAPRLAAN
jgi:hypothetical protein